MGKLKGRPTQAPAVFWQGNIPASVHVKNMHSQQVSITSIDFLENYLKRCMEVSHRMKIQICEKCGGGEFVDRDGYRICQYCNTKYLVTPEDITQKGSSIALDNDIKMLLQKCQDDPANARRYASLVLDMDPGNVDAIKYIKRR